MSKVITGKKPAAKKLIKRRAFTLLLPEYVYEQLGRLAERNGRSKTRQVEFAIKEQAEREGIE